MSGEWRLSTGGLTEYCQDGQHFTTGPIWKLWIGIVSKCAVCEACAGNLDTSVRP